MPRKKINILHSLQTKTASGILAHLERPLSPILPLGIENLLAILNSKTNNKKSEEMYCFIMYDIENNKVRVLIAKYLEKKGCTRVQKSIFFAKLHRREFVDISNTLKEIQEAYENKDSIMLLPVGEDMLNSLKVYGKAFEYEFLANTPHTMFF